MASDLEQLYTASYRRIVRQVAVLTQDMSEAEDMVQEAFSRAMGRWTILARYDDPEAWVRVVAMNLARSRWRRAVRATALLRRLEPNLTHSPPPNPDRVAVVSALRTLPTSQREALVLYHLADLSIDEISQQVGVPPNTVKSRLARGRTSLAEALDDTDMTTETNCGAGR